MPKKKAATKRPTRAKRAVPPEAAAPDVLDLKEAAEFLKVSKPTFFRWLAQDRIKGFKAGQQWRFYRADLEAFLKTEEPSALRVDGDGLRSAVDKGRRKRGLPAVKWQVKEEATSEESAVIQTVNTIIGDALDARASDIHLDHEHEATIVRYRTDGVLGEVLRLPREAGWAIVSRLKLMGDMDILERRLPQHGRISIERSGREYDLRLTTIAAMFGESAILRILDQSSVLVGLDKLGFSKQMQASFEEKLRVNTGMVIIAGPAGSGRTTTLYSALQSVNSPEKKIVTIEDPVEYRIPNAMQVHVNRKVGLTTAAALRTIVRCDPDFIVVGELKDKETAVNCVNAAMTGHLVLTTMHGREAPSVVTRLIEMGVEPFLVGSSLVAVLAQRLARRVCEHCRTEDTPNPDLMARLHKETSIDLARTEFRRGKGCAECRQTGYRGRISLFELLVVDEGLRELIARPASTADIRAAAIEAGMTTLLADGVEKAARGVTTVAEVMRVLAIE